MGGDIHCESVPGQGTTFTVSIPFEWIDEERISDEGTVLTSTEGPNDFCAEEVCCIQHPHVLIVEDNSVNQTVAKRFLQKLGCTAEIANHGQQGLDMLRESEFDLVLMDCQMPILDGYEATRKIRAGACGEAKKDIFISAITAHAMKGDMDRCLRSGMDTYVSKPLKLQDIKQILQLCKVKLRK